MSFVIVFKTNVMTNDINEQVHAANDSDTNRPLTTQGDSAEQEENMGGTTNLSLDQLKEEGGPSSTSLEDTEEEDDLREIQAGDDISEPDPEESYPATDEGDDVDDEEAGQIL